MSGLAHAPWHAGAGRRLPRTRRRSASRAVAARGEVAWPYQFGPLVLRGGEVIRIGRGGGDVGEPAGPHQRHGNDGHSIGGEQPPRRKRPPRQERLMALLASTSRKSAATGPFITAPSDRPVVDDEGEIGVGNDEDEDQLRRAAPPGGDGRGGALSVCTSAGVVIASTGSTTASPPARLFDARRSPLLRPRRVVMRAAAQTPRRRRVSAPGGAGTRGVEERWRASARSSSGGPHATRSQIMGGVMALRPVKTVVSWRSRRRCSFRRSSWTRTTRAPSPSCAR
jgi:hypothetical protein